METLFLTLLFVMAVFLILLVLVQRGRGGGLAGALGGPGGSSAFGAKAGDTFTKITIWGAAAWIVLCVLAALWTKNRGDALGDGDPRAGAAAAPLFDDGAGAPGDGPAGPADAPAANDDNKELAAAPADDDAPAEE